MESLALLPRALGSLFYFSPNHPVNQALLNDPAALEALYEAVVGDDTAAWRAQQLKSLLAEADEAEYQFSVLFEGQGEMPAPPWGAVYQNPENSLMDERYGEYTRFLKRNGIEIETVNVEPLDQFGLMLWALAALIEDDQLESAAMLMSDYLLPWAYRYLELLQANEVSPFYRELGVLAHQFLRQQQQQMNIFPKAVRLFK